jgi:hypothetical protein
MFRRAGAAAPGQAKAGSIKVDIGMVVEGGAGAKEAEFRPCGDLVAGAGGNEDGVAGADVTGFAIDVHEGRALEEEIKFLAEFVVVAFGGLTRSHGGLGQTVFFHGRIGAVEDAANGGAVFGREGALIFELLDYHLRIICDFSKVARL